jgi:pimeloyl-ACP methyl ester carboxylesterase
MTQHRTITVGGVQIFYREAGPIDAPALLLLHGYPSSSHMFRELIPALSERYRVVAPDLPGFGFSDAPRPPAFEYTFDRLARTVEAFVDAVGLERYALYIFDYGAPVGLRLAMWRPERVTAIVTQNGNAYEEGLSDGWSTIRSYWQEPTAARRRALADFVSADSVRFQYVHGTERSVAPEGYTLDAALLARPGIAELQLDLLLDYRSNVALYPIFQRYLREHAPPLLAIWGGHDPYFLPAGAEAFRRDVPAAEVRILPTGHFALETHAPEIAAAMHDFLARVHAPPSRVQAVT